MDIKVGDRVAYKTGTYQVTGIRRGRYHTRATKFGQRDLGTPWVHVRLQLHSVCPVWVNLDSCQVLEGEA